jgi:hypothetical protein
MNTKTVASRATASAPSSRRVCAAPMHSRRRSWWRGPTGPSAETPRRPAAGEDGEGGRDDGGGGAAAAGAGDEVVLLLPPRLRDPCCGVPLPRCPEALACALHDGFDSSGTLKGSIEVGARHMGLACVPDRAQQLWARSGEFWGYWKGCMNDKHTTCLSAQVSAASVYGCWRRAQRTAGWRRLALSAQRQLACFQLTFDVSPIVISGWLRRSYILHASTEPQLWTAIPSACDVFGPLAVRAAAHRLRTEQPPAAASQSSPIATSESNQCKHLIYICISTPVSRRPPVSAPPLSNSPHHPRFGIGQGRHHHAATGGVTGVVRLVGRKGKAGVGEES